MRLFIAIDLPRSFKAELARIQKEVKGISCGGKFVPQDNFHITLHFIGESDDIAGAAEAMREAVRGIRPFTLHLGKYTSLEKGSHGRTAVPRGSAARPDQAPISVSCTASSASCSDASIR